MNIEIPKANTHRDVAKEQHLVPRTYMRKWSYNNSDSIYVFDKNKREINMFLEKYYDRYTGLYMKSKDFLKQIG